MIYAIPYYFLIPFFLCWGSFLNVLAYRLIQGKSIVRPRSACPKCQTVIAWYDNIPIFSWLFLQGKCRTCKKPISLLYPCIEIITTIALILLYSNISLHYFFGYFIFFSALIVTIRSDIETMLISRYATVFLAPCGFLMSVYGFIPLSPRESICGAFFGYFFLFSVNAIFKYWRDIDGIGEGDFDLLFFIGSFTGIIGCWISIMIGSLLGSLYGIINLLIAPHHQNYRNTANITKIPFGPFLACGALIFIFIQRYVFKYMFLQ